MAAGQKYNDISFVAVFLFGIILLAVGKVISLLQGIHLYNQILTEKMAGSELAKYVIENRLDVGEYKISKKDLRRYEKIVAEDATKKFLGK
ncbi:MAG: hypothetical protein P8M25_06220 [Paracoccaceae bacterium]|nr:hypothetical protein [Paracoccaceae bacterium]